MTLVQIILIASAAVGVLALLLYFVPVSKLKVPAVILGAVAGLGAGAVIGMAATVYYGDAIMAEQKSKRIVVGDGDGSTDASGGRNARGGGPAGAQPKMPIVRAEVGGGGGGPQGKGGRGGGPNAQTQLAQLITKLDLLTSKSLPIELTVEQKKVIQEQLDGLEDEQAVNNDAAKAKLDAILEVVKEKRSTLEDAGFRWPNSGGGMTPPARVTPNPFAQGPNKNRVQSLRATIGGSEAKPPSAQG
jgi:hypothetical protein